MFKVKETVTNNKIPITHGAGANKYVYHSRTITSAQRTNLRPMAKERNDEMVYDVNGCSKRTKLIAFYLDRLYMLFVCFF